VPPRARLPFLLSWLHLALLIRGILGSRWDEETWMAAKAELGRALALRCQLAKAPW